MEAEKRATTLRARKPLSDCTNTLTSSQSSSSSTSIVKPTKPTLSSAIKKLIDPNSTRNLKSKPHFSVRSAKNRRDDNVENPSSVSQALASTPSRPEKYSSVSGPGGCETSEPHTVYARRQSADKRKTKGKAINMPLSCSLAENISNIGEKKNSNADIGQSKPCAPKKKLRRAQPEPVASEHGLKDYIEQQRAYFAEIDAFELPEEEVASVEELE